MGRKEKRENLVKKKGKIMWVVKEEGNDLEFAQRLSQGTTSH